MSPRRSEGGHGPGFQAHPATAAIARDADEVVENRPTDPATSRRLGGVHGLQLRVVPVKLLQRSDSEELAVPPEAEERDDRIEETVNVQGVDVLGRGVRMGEREVAPQQLANVLRSRVVHRDLVLRHSKNLRDPAGW